MALFPALQPSSRVFSPGDYPHTSFPTMSGKANRVRHSTVMLGSRLQLSFVAISQTDMLAIKAHYDVQQGTYLSFPLPAILTDGLTAADFTLTGYAWRYVEPPQVEDFCPQLHTVSVVLESLPPEGVVAGGTSQATNMIVRLGMAAGVARADANLNGAAVTVTTTLAPGLGSADLVQTSGLDQTITASLASGAAAASNGLDLTVNASLAAGAATAITQDPDFNSVSLLLHMNGSNGSTTFTDSSSAARTVTRYADAQISTTQSKFGGASGYFDGSGDYLSLASDQAFVFNGDFTIEAWIYCSNLNSNKGIFASSAERFGLIRVENFIYWLGSSDISGSSILLSATTWHHVVACRSGSTLRLFVDGAQAGSGASTQTPALNTWFVASNQSGEHFNGYIDDLRVTKGVARYTSAFTPPAAAFPDS